MCKSKKAAKWLAVNAHEGEAINEIDKAIGELKAAAIDDGKNVNDHPGAD